MVDLVRAAFHEAGHACACLAFGIPVVEIDIISAVPHMTRAAYRPPRHLGVDALAVICFSGPEAERHFCGRIVDGGDEADEAMARHYLRRYNAFRAAQEMLLCRLRAERLVRTPWAAARIRALAVALLQHGTLSVEEILAVGNK